MGEDFTQLLVVLPKNVALELSLLCQIPLFTDRAIGSHLPQVETQQLLPPALPPAKTPCPVGGPTSPL